VPFDESEHALLTFTTYSSARQRLDEWIHASQLCLRYCGLTAGDSVCFNHQLKECNGICAGEEEVAVYNERAERILEHHLFARKDFVIVEKGRSTGENSIVLVEDSHYAGYGFYDASEQISHPDALRAHVSKRTYFPDMDDLVRQYVNQGKGRIIKLDTPSKEILQAAEPSPEWEDCDPIWPDH
jgi:DNA polymerase-3 subunit epsilon